jgi:hypothetical protein
MDGSGGKGGEDIGVSGIAMMGSRKEIYVGLKVHSCTHVCTAGTAPSTSSCGRQKSSANHCRSDQLLPSAPSDLRFITLGDFWSENVVCRDLQVRACTRRT